jgi:hypothetical protein
MNESKETKIWKRRRMKVQKKLFPVMLQGTSSMCSGILFHIYQMLCFRRDQEGTHGSVASLWSGCNDPGAQFPHSWPETGGAHVRCSIHYTFHCHLQVFRRCWYYLQPCVIASSGQNIHNLIRRNCCCSRNFQNVQHSLFLVFDCLRDKNKCVNT